MSEIRPRSFEDLKPGEPCSACGAKWQEGFRFHEQRCRYMEERDCDECNGLRAALAGSKAECEYLFKISKERQAEAVEARNLAGEASGAWVWGGGEEDHLESMGDGMAVLITAGQLREVLAERDKEFRILKEVREPGGCECSDEDACRFARERDEARGKFETATKETEKAVDALQKEAQRGDGYFLKLEAVREWTKERGRATYAPHPQAYYGYKSAQEDVQAIIGEEGDDDENKKTD